MWKSRIIVCNAYFIQSFLAHFGKDNNNFGRHCLLFSRKFWLQHLMLKKSACFA